MQKTKKIAMFALAAAACAALVSPAVAAEALVGLDLQSAYVWRGVTFNDGAVLQPSMNVEHPAGVGFNAWGNMDLDDYNNTLESGEMSEVDLTLYYNLPVEQVDMSVGYIEYLFPATSPSNGTVGTRELYFSVGQNLGLYDWVNTSAPGGILAGMGWGWFFAYDIDEYDDYYTNLSLTYGYDVNEQLNLELGGLVGYTGAGTSVGGNSGWNEWQLSLAGTYDVTENTALGAYVAYVDSLDTDVLPTQDVDFFGGISVYYGF